MTSIPISRSIISPLAARWVLGTLAALIAYKTARFAGLGAPPFVEFNVFHIAGEMAWQGKTGLTYSAAEFAKYQRLASGNGVFMPWAYPPPFNLVAALLALIPLPLAYALFTGSSLVAYLAVLRRLAGEQFPFVLAALFPAMIVCASCGQNSFLTGALIGLAAIYMLEDRARAGIPLGLMIVKPHMAIPFALTALLGRFWRTAGVAAATVAGCCLLATAVFGISVWQAFLGGAEEAKRFLEGGFYPLQRMISPFATLASLGVPVRLALFVQMLAAAAMLVAAGAAIWRQMPMRHVLGFSAMVSPFISPYAYDYDVCITGAGLALLMPDLARRLTEREQTALLGLLIAGGAASLLQQLRLEAAPAFGSTAVAAGMPSFGAVAFLLVIALVWRALVRGEKSAWQGVSDNCAAPASAGR